MARVDEKGLIPPTEDDSISQLEAFAHNYALGQAAIEELEKIKPMFALAVSRLPKQQFKVSVSDLARLDELELQMKMETKSGAIVFRAVKA